MSRYAVRWYGICFVVLVVLLASTSYTDWITLMDNNEHRQISVQKTKTNETIESSASGSNKLSHYDGVQQETPSPDQDHTGKVNESLFFALKTQPPTEIMADAPYDTETARTNSTTNQTSLPWPVQFLELYKSEHSIEAVLRDHGQSRKYAVVYYYCPHRAGNILHNLFTSISWAMIHNRTILWQYDTGADHAQTPQECQNVLRLATWLLGWEEWKERLHLEEPVPISLDIDRIQEEQRHTTVIFPQIRDVLKDNPTVARIEWRYDPSHMRKYVGYVVELGEDAKHRAAMMWYHGVDFLFGMLFRDIFTVLVAVENPFLPNSTTDEPSFSLALHSRHTVIGDDGSFVNDEVKCLTEMLPDTRSPQTCVVYLMSDRPKTIHKLQLWLANQNCTGVSASDTKTSTFFDEMGPNQGAGFIQELELASSARSGLIGDFHRSSFMLLVELVEYDRRMESWKRGNELGDNEKISICDIPERYGKGYDYGPGTPTFRAAHHREPLDPIQVMNLYKSYHSLDALRAETSTNSSITLGNRHFLLSILPCPMDASLDYLQKFLDDVLLAIETNTTLLWRCNETEENASCDGIIFPQNWLPNVEDVRSLSGYHDDQLHVVENTSAITKPREPNSFAHSSGTQGGMLYSEGLDFLKGMLLDTVFSFQPAIHPPNATQASGNSFTFGIFTDSLHNFNFVDVESCELSTLSHLNESCHVYVISDNRTEPFGGPERLGNCSVSYVYHESTAGIGKGENIAFFQDLLFVGRHVRSGLFGTFADSTKKALLIQRIEYFRRLYSWRQGRIPRILPDFLTCPSEFQVQ